VRAIAIQAGLACLLVCLGSFGEIVAYFVFVTVAFIALTVAGLYRLPRPPAGAYRIPGYPVTPLAFLALLVTLLALLAAGRPKQAALGALAVAMGAPVYRYLVAPRRHALPIAEPVEET
jgi:APA family basic amino acid/polyamine antiporter